MIKPLFIICFMILVCSCSLSRYFDNISNTDRRLKKLDSIVLDDSYTLYTRAICQPLDNKNALRNDCRELIHDSTDRVEIEYLLLSMKNGNMIYISAIPHLLPGWYSKPFYKSNKRLNFDDFNRFHFGKIEPNQRRISLQETNKPWQDLWEFELDQEGNFRITGYTDSLTRKKARVMDTKTALSFPVRFLRQDSFSIGYQLFVNAGKEDSFIPLERKVIYFRKKNWKTFFIGFRTQRPYRDNYQYAEFQPFRTRYSPVRLKN